MNIARFHEIDRDTDFLFPPSVQDWLPKNHLALYIANVVESLDLGAIERSYAARGSDAYQANFRLRFGDEFKSLFVQVRRLPRPID